MKHTWKKGNRHFPQTWLAKFYRENVLELTQQQVCEMTGVKQSNLSAHEGGKWQPGVHNAYIDMGLIVFFDNLTYREADVMWELYTHFWAKKLAKRFPGQVLIKEEWVNED